MPKKERYQISIRVRKEQREHVDDLVSKTGKNITAVVLEGIDLFDKKYRNQFSPGKKGQLYTMASHTDTIDR